MPQGASFAIAPLDAVKVEDPRGITSYTFTVTRTGDLSAAAALAYAVTGSGANPATPDDFVGGAFPSGTVPFAPGDASQTITVPVQGRTTARPAAGFTVALSGPAGTATTGASADGLIRTDDADQIVSAFAASAVPPNSGFYPLYSMGPPGLVSAVLAKPAGGPSGKVAVSNAPAGPFRAPVPGQANAAVATAPAAGSTLALPAGYDALVARGSSPVTLTDGGATGALIGNAGGDTFNSTGAGAALVGGGKDVFNVYGSAYVCIVGGPSAVFANGAATVGITNYGAATAVLGSGACSFTNSGQSAAVFCGAGEARVGQFFGTNLIVVGGSGRVTSDSIGGGDVVIFGGKGGVTFTNDSGVGGSDTVVGGSGAVNIKASGMSGSFWGYSGQDVITASGSFNTVAGVSGDKLTITGGLRNTFISLTGGVVMDGSQSAGSTVFYGGSAGTDTILTGGYAPRAGQPDLGSTIVVAGSNSSAVQLGAGKATVFANGSSTVTSGAGSADLVFNDRTQFLLNAVAPGSTRVFALFNFVPGTEHVTLQQYNPNAAAYALANQVNDPGYTTLTLPDQTRILLLGVGRADASVFG